MEAGELGVWVWGNIGVTANLRASTYGSEQNTLRS